MTTRDIQAHIKDLYNSEISPETVSAITDRVLERAREWQGRPLDTLYAVISMDACLPENEDRRPCPECGSLNDHRDQPERAEGMPGAVDLRGGRGFEKVDLSPPGLGYDILAARDLL